MEDLKEGDILITDGGFTCVEDQENVPVHRDDQGHLYFNCEEGRHHLVGQLDDENYLVGLTRAR